MGYETELYLIDVEVPASHLAHAKKLLEKQRLAKNPTSSYFCYVVDFNSDGQLSFVAKLAKKKGWRVNYVPGDDGFVPAIVGKCYQSEKFARWLCRNGFNGSVIQHSGEGDGAAWGWEFKNGRIRYLQMNPCSSWQPLRRRKAIKNNLLR